MKFLIVTDVYPLPENSGGNIRTMHFARYFRKYGEVDLIHYNKMRVSQNNESLFRRTYFVDKFKGGNNEGVFREIVHKIRYLKPWIVSHFTRECIDSVTETIKAGEYDLILCRYAHNAYPLFFLPSRISGNVIVDIDDFISRDLYESIHQIKLQLSNFKHYLDFLFYKLYQIKCARKWKTLICSENDRMKTLELIRRDKVFIVPNITPEFTKPENYCMDAHHKLKTMLFVGTLNYKPNIDGLIWFIDEVFERLSRDEPDIRLIIAGKDPEAELRARCTGNNRIELIESPPDIVPYYDECGVVIVPLFAGGGTRIKILEAGLVHRPVISTQMGIYGLQLTDYRNVLCMNDYNTFVERYKWLKTKGNYSEVVSNLNDYVVRNFSKSSFESAFDKVTGLH